MNNFYNTLMGLGNNLKNNTQTLFSRITGTGSATGGAAQVNNDSDALPNIQFDINGEYDPIKSAELDLHNKQETTPLKLSERLLGREYSTDIQNLNPETGEMQLTTVRNNRPGFLNDMMSGAKENLNNEFQVNNWGNNLTSDGREKGLGYRIGEGFGTIARGLSDWAGDAFVAGYNGLDAGLKRQATRTNDQLYRQSLKDNYGFSDEDLNNVKGFIDDTTFNNLTKSQNSAMNIALKQQTTQSMNKLRELQIEKQRIINSTLPEMEKAKLLKANAEAAHAEEMQLAKINYYNNAVANPLGWANFGLKQNEAELKAKELEAKLKVYEELFGGNGEGKSTINSQPQQGQKGRAF